MDKAKAAVSSFMSKSGHHDTTVHEKTAPAVQHENVNVHQRNEQQIARDREVHQDHYHTTVQPVHDKEVLPEQHHHNMAATEHRTHDHRNHEHTKDKLEREAAQFTNRTTRGDTQHTSSTAQEAVGEHVHHHVHETVQPIVQKETIEPHVVHTTVPIHETHHNEARHHQASTLPAVNMSDFKQSHGGLTGRAETTDHFAGEPRAAGFAGETLHHEGAGHHIGAGQSHSGTGIGHNSSHQGMGVQGMTGNSGMTGTSGMTGNSGMTGTHGTHGTHDTTHKKPSLMDKLNPKVDANGDGKAGFMK